MPPSLPELLAGTPLSGANAPYVEALYEQYLRSPDTVDPAWRSYFDTLPPSDGPEQAHSPVIAAVAARMQAARGGASVAPAAADAGEKQAAVSRLMQIYSNRGHLLANIDPLASLRARGPACSTWIIRAEPKRPRCGVLPAAAAPRCPSA